MNSDLERQNFSYLLEEFCDILTKELVNLEGQHRILHKTFNLGFNINLIETVIVTFIIRLKKIKLDDSFSKYKNENSLSFSYYQGLVKLYVKSVFAKLRFRFFRKEYRNRICFFEYYAHNLQISEPLFNKGGENVLYVSLREEVLARIKNKYTSVSNDYFHPIDIISSFKVNNAVNKFTELVFDSIDKKFRNDLLRFSFAYFLKRELSGVIRHIKQYQRMLEYLKPQKGIFTTDSVPANRILVLLCKMKGIKTVTIQHGLIANSILLKFIICDHYLVWGDYYKNLIKMYNDKVEVHVVGSLKHSNLIQMYGGVRKDPRKILLATSPPSGTSVFLRDYYRILDLFWHAAKMRPEYLFYLKPHPSEKSNVLHDYCKEKGVLNNIFILSRTSNIYSDIADSSLVLFVGSTVSLESLLLNTPVICINLGFFNTLNFLPYNGVAGFFEVNDEANLVISIDKLIGSKNICSSSGETVEKFCLKHYRNEEAVKIVL